MNKKLLGLYIHIPFCDKKCPYCDFYSFTADERTKDEYTAAIIRNIILGQEKTENGFSLAAPVCTDRPMPLTVLACLADLERLDGSLCWVWHFDRMGQTVPAHKGEKVKPN